MKPEPRTLDEMRSDLAIQMAHVYATESHLQSMKREFAAALLLPANDWNQMEVARLRQAVKSAAWAARKAWQVAVPLASAKPKVRK